MACRGSMAKIRCGTSTDMTPPSHGLPESLTVRRTRMRRAISCTHPLPAWMRICRNSHFAAPPAARRRQAGALARYSNFFQNLDHTDAGARPEAIEAVFPTMDYEFWKLIAQSASNDPGSGIYYFQYAGNGTNNLFKGPSGKVQDIIKWLNALPN